MKRKPNSTFAVICTSSLEGIIKVFEGAWLTDFAIDFCPWEAPVLAECAIFKMIPTEGNKASMGKQLGIYQSVCNCLVRKFLRHMEMHSFQEKHELSEHTKIFFSICCMKYSRVYRSICHLDFHTMTNKTCR